MTIKMKLYKFHVEMAREESKSWPIIFLSTVAEGRSLLSESWTLDLEKICESILFKFSEPKLINANVNLAERSVL